MIDFAATLFRRWLSHARSLFADVRAGYRRDGWFGAGFEAGLWFKSLYALTLGAPLIFGELHALTRTAEGLRAALRSGLTPESYVAAQCARIGVPVGSPTYHAVLAWAWSFRNYLESSGSLPRAPVAEAWDDVIAG